MYFKVYLYHFLYYNSTIYSKFNNICDCYLCILYFAKKVEFGLPILEGWLEGKPVKDYLISILPISIGLGILASILIIGLDYLFSFAGVTIILNSICRIIFGWIYWKKGLESAMIAHFSADIVLHVTPALILVNTI